MSRGASFREKVGAMKLIARKIRRKINNPKDPEWAEFRIELHISGRSQHVFNTAFGCLDVI